MKKNGFVGFFKMTIAENPRIFAILCGSFSCQNDNREPGEKPGRTRRCNFLAYVNNEMGTVKVQKTTAECVQCAGWREG